MNEYRYTDCGLDDVIIHNASFVKDDEGEAVTIIPHINLLHKEIALGIILADGSMNGKELRFLRTHLGLTQDELAEKLHKERLTVGRWERGEVPIENMAEVFVRLKVAGHLSEHILIDECSAKCVQKAKKQPIRIDGSNPKEYKLMAA